MAKNDRFKQDKEQSQAALKIKPKSHLFPSAAEDRIRASRRSNEEYAKEQINSPSYKLAFDDMDFLLSDELRPVRLLLELEKPELALKESGVEHTVIIFGSARTDQSSPYYAQARELATLISERSSCDDCPELVVATGGGPGVMEAANRGAHDVGAKSIGLNIVLPHEQYPNPYITPEFCFRFHYFAMRKMHFLLRAKAMVAFPGGFGTLDELFETLTLVQTGKIETMPMIIFGKEYWQKLINFDLLVEQGMISKTDLELFHFVDTVEEAWEIIKKSLADSV